MLDQVPYAGEPRAASLAQVWLDARVQTAVRHETLAVGERLGAVQTSERFLPGVFALVYLQLPFPVKRFFAEFTGKFLLIGVHSHV